MAASPGLAVLQQCALQVQKILALEDLISPAPAVVARAEQLSSDLQALLDMAATAAECTKDKDNQSRITHILVTNAGLESVTAMEASSATGAGLVVPRPFGVAGYVGLGGLQAGSEDSLQSLRSIHDVLTYHAHLHLKVSAEGSAEQKADATLQHLAQGVAAVSSLDEVLKSAESFRVRCERTGGILDTTQDNDKDRRKMRKRTRDEEDEVCG
jgi:hypothetical protein